MNLITENEPDRNTCPQLPAANQLRLEILPLPKVLTSFEIAVCTYINICRQFLQSFKQVLLLKSFYEQWKRIS